MAKKETYTIKTVCTNCGHTPFSGVTGSILLEIPKGTKVWPFVSGRKCENCGCVGTLKRRS